MKNVTCAALQQLCAAGSKTRRFDRDIKSKLKIMSLEVDSAHQIECSTTAIGNEYGLLCFRSMKNIGFEYDQWVVETQLCKLHDIFVSPVQPALLPGSPRTDGFHVLSIDLHRVGTSKSDEISKYTSSATSSHIPHITPLARNDT